MGFVYFSFHSSKLFGNKSKWWMLDLALALIIFMAGDRVAGEGLASILFLFFMILVFLTVMIITSVLYWKASHKTV